MLCFYGCLFKISANERVLAMAGKKKSEISILTRLSQCFFGLPKLQKKAIQKAVAAKNF